VSQDVVPLAPYSSPGVHHTPPIPSPVVVIPVDLAPNLADPAAGNIEDGDQDLDETIPTPEPFDYPSDSDSDTIRLIELHLLFLWRIHTVYL